MGDGTGQQEMVRILEHYPALGRDLPPSARYPAHSAAIAPVLTLAAGAKAFFRDEPPPRGHLGLLVLDGLIALHVGFGEIGAIEFLGPYDLLRPWAINETVEMADAHWVAHSSARLAVLDRDFATRAHGRSWPQPCSTATASGWAHSCCTPRREESGAWRTECTLRSGTSRSDGDKRTANAGSYGCPASQVRYSRTSSVPGDRR